MLTIRHTDKIFGNHCWEREIWVACAHHLIFKNSAGWWNRISAENIDLKLLLYFWNNFFPTKKFQSLIKDLVKRKDFLTFDTYLRQILINHHWEKLLTKIAFFKNSVLPNFPNLVKLSKRLEIIKEWCLTKVISSDFWQNIL